MLPEPITAAMVSMAPPSCPPPPPPPAHPPPPPPGSRPVQRTHDWVRVENPDCEPEEASAHSYIHKVFDGTWSTSHFCGIMADFAAQPMGSGPRNLYSNVRRLLHEMVCRVHECSTKDNEAMGVLIGSLINIDAVGYEDPNEGLALLLPAVQRALCTPTAPPMVFCFGIVALEAFLDKLERIPQFCRWLAEAEHVAASYPEYVSFAQEILRALPKHLHDRWWLMPHELLGPNMPKLPKRAADNNVAVTMYLPSQRQALREATPQARHTGTGNGATSSAVPPPAPVADAGPFQPQRPPGVGSGATSSSAPPPFSPFDAGPFQPQRPPGAGSGLTSIVVPPSAPPIDAGPFQPQRHPGARHEPASSAAPAFAPVIDAGPFQPQQPQRPPGAPYNDRNVQVETLRDVSPDTPLFDYRDLQLGRPPARFMTDALSILDALDKGNVVDVAEQMRAALQEEFHQWLLYAFIRNWVVCINTDMHPIYIQFLEVLNFPGWLALLTNMTYDCLKVLFARLRHACGHAFHHRVLRHIGKLLGQLTLARDRTLKLMRVNLKELLLYGFDTGRLHALLPFVCQVLEGAVSSRAYQTTAPYTQAIISLLAEIVDVPNLKMGLVYEVETLCKKLGFNCDEVSRSRQLVGKQHPSCSNDIAPEEVKENEGQTPYAPLILAGEVGVAPEMATAYPGAESQWFPVAHEQMANPVDVAVPCPMGQDLPPGCYWFVDPGGNLHTAVVVPTTAPVEFVPPQAGPSLVPTRDEQVHLGINPSILLFQHHPELRSLVIDGFAQAFNHTHQKVISSFDSDPHALQHLATVDPLQLDFTNELRSALMLNLSARLAPAALRLAVDEDGIQEVLTWLTEDNMEAAHRVVVASIIHNRGYRMQATPEDGLLVTLCDEADFITTRSSESPAETPVSRAQPSAPKNVRKVTNKKLEQEPVSPPPPPAAG